MCGKKKFVNSHFALNIKLHDDCWGELYPFCLWKSEHKFIGDMTGAGIYNSYNVLNCSFPPTQKRCRSNELLQQINSGRSHFFGSKMWVDRTSLWRRRCWWSRQFLWFQLMWYRHLSSSCLLSGPQYLCGNRCGMRISYLIPQCISVGNIEHFSFPNIERQIYRIQRFQFQLSWSEN